MGGGAESAMGAGRAKSSGAWFSGKTLTMGVSGENGGSGPSGAGPAITVLHGRRRWSRKGSKSSRVIDRRYGLMTRRGSMPNARHWPGGCNGGAAAGPLAKMVRVLPHTSCGQREASDLTAPRLPEWITFGLGYRFRAPNESSFSR